MLIKAFIEYFIGKDGLIICVIFDHACISWFTFSFRHREIFREQLIRILYQFFRFLILFLNFLNDFPGLQLDLNNAICSDECLIEVLILLAGLFLVLRWIFRYVIFDLLLGEVGDDGIDEVLLNILSGEVVELAEPAGLVALVMLDGNTVGLGLFLALLDGLVD